MEFEEVAGKLVDEGYDVVVPSRPGYGFSEILSYEEDLHSRGLVKDEHGYTLPEDGGGLEDEDENNVDGDTTETMVEGVIGNTEIAKMMLVLMHTLLNLVLLPLLKLLITSKS